MYSHNSAASRFKSIAGPRRERIAQQRDHPAEAVAVVIRERAHRKHAKQFVSCENDRIRVAASQAGQCRLDRERDSRGRLILSNTRLPDWRYVRTPTSPIASHCSRRSAILIRLCVPTLTARRNATYCTPGSLSASGPRRPRHRPNRDRQGAERCGAPARPRRERPRLKGRVAGEATSLRFLTGAVRMRPALGLAVAVLNELSTPSVPVAPAHQQPQN